ncbi:hypothetical protein RHGRI_002100 [Rhododendron griersonianum]|uniref:mannan endo-1,4-beta-mannosidase n=1 Tax=Rhododendron griersonianum TaxID=479676 RepID=A0AAV6LMJ5_9ERIC|nr:hypothetical protein RHGRI_002100 [Rhododendron griersonianum]
MVVCWWWWSGGGVIVAVSSSGGGGVIWGRVYGGRRSLWCFRNLEAESGGTPRWRVGAAWSSAVMIVCKAVVLGVADEEPSHARTNPAGQGFAKTSGTHFVMNGRTLYLNGFNAYWLMNMAVDPSTRGKVTTTFQQASKEGMNVARAWAFSDGGYGSLQSSPGSYNEDVFKGLDFVVAEARKYGVYLILTLVNNWDDYGGKKQYVQWARDRGQSSLNNNDDFYTNPVVKGYFKNHVKVCIYTPKNLIMWRPGKIRCQQLTHLSPFDFKMSLPHHFD